MSMIQCPECGREISDKAKTCPHCGVSIYVCPECKQVSTVSEGACPHCGYVQTENTPVFRPQEQVQNTVAAGAEEDDGVVRWLKENPKEQKWCKPNGLFLNMMGILIDVAIVGVILCLYFFIQQPFEKMGESKDYLGTLKMIMNYKVYIRNVWILAIFACILWIPQAVIVIYRDLWAIRCANWLKAKKINIKEVLKNESVEFQDGTFNGSKKWDGYQISNVQRAYMYDSAINQSNGAYIAICIFRQVISLLFISTIVMVYARNVCDMIEKNAVWGMQVSLFDGELTEFFVMLGVLLGVIVLFFVMIALINSRQFKRIKADFHNLLSK